jgi:GTP-binding protein EngB required for normal cell division
MVENNQKINIVLAGQGNAGKSAVFNYHDGSASTHRQLGRKNHRKT